MGVAVASANRIGCYKGNQGPGYTNHLGQLKWFGNEGTGKLTPQLCQDHCSASGSKYYALVWGEQCGCMNNLSGEKVGDGECNQPCVGDYSKKCGGSYSGDRNPADVYQIGGGGSQQPATQAPTQPTTKKPTQPPPPPCEDKQTANWCSSKCNNEKKCTSKAVCQQKCEKTCGICDDGSVALGRAGSGECPAGKYDYCEVLDKSMLFYEAQRAGHLPADERVKWRGDSNLGDDPQGGYYDAGDFLKFGFPAAAMTTNLAWGAISFLEGYNTCGELEDIKKTIKWSTDYMIDANRLQTDGELIGQIGLGDADHGYWGRPEDMNMYRPVFSVSPSSPGSDLAGESAAALFYNSWSGYDDELAWGAAWLYKATEDPTYLEKAKKYFNSGNMCESNLWFGWDNKKAGVEVLMYDITGQDPAYKKCVDNFLDQLDSAHYTPKGLIFVDNWGSNRHAGNNALLCAQLAEMGYQNTKCDKFVHDQIGYLLGDTGRSYMVGFGENPPLRPHHRASSCPDMPAPCGDNEKNSPAPNPQTLTGALVGGPDNWDNYNDARDDYISNEVAIDYNAGFQGAVAYLAKHDC